MLWGGLHLAVSPPHCCVRFFSLVSSLTAWKQNCLNTSKLYWSIFLFERPEICRRRRRFPFSRKLTAEEVCWWRSKSLRPNKCYIQHISWASFWWFILGFFCCFFFSFLVVVPTLCPGLFHCSLGIAVWSTLGHFLHQDIGYTNLKPSWPLTLGPRRVTCVKKEVFFETGDKNACFASVVHLGF